MVVLSGAVANSSSRDLYFDPSDFPSNAVQFVAGERAARNAEKFALKQQENAGKFALKQQKMELASNASMQKRELSELAKRNQAVARGQRLAGLGPVIESLSQAFKPASDLSAELLLKQYEVLSRNRSNPFQTAEGALAAANRFQTLTDGLGPNVLAPYLAKGLNDYYPNIDPFSQTSLSPTQGFL